jgi:hypothetical protein
LSRPIMVRSRRESLHSDGITDQKILQGTSATKSTLKRQRQSPTAPCLNIGLVLASRQVLGPKSAEK